MSPINSSPVKPSNVVVLEDDQTTSQLLCLTLKKAGFVPLPCFCAKEALQIFKEGARISAMLVDLSLPDGDGIGVMRRGRRAYPGLPCFVLTARETVESVVEAIKAGAENYFVKPFTPEILVPALAEAIKVFHGTQNSWSDEFIPPPSLRRWKSERMRDAVELASQASKTTSPVMITGAPYTSKSGFAKLIHQGGELKGKPMTTINLAALSPLQVETELFGAPLEKLHDTFLSGRGKLARCRGETLYIENIDRLHPAAQHYFLTLINDGNVPIKGKMPPCRLITSSTVDFQVKIREGDFRSDLWYVLSVYKVQVPCLAERPEDIPLLCESIITQICLTTGLRRPTLTRKALEVLFDHSWPGNLSELNSCLEHAVTRTKDGLIGPDDFPYLNRQQGPNTATALPIGASSIDEITKLTLLAALEACGGNRRRAAKRLKISLRTVYNMIERYGLPKKARKISQGDSAES